jgi:hypothetical protein
MSAREVIEAYVTDVAVRLPRRQRDDVAYELRALLEEGLARLAEDAGREPDAAMATEFLREFGRPAEVAARYRPAVVVVDPADGPAFVRATVIGLAILWALGLGANLRQAIDSGTDLVTALGRWWGGTVIASLWWPGLLVVGFGLAAWARRRWPQSAEWTPRSPDRIRGGRGAVAMGILGILCGLFLLLDPRWLLDLLFGGRAAPAAYEAMTYTDGFRARQAPIVFGLVLLNVPILAAVLVRGRWSAGLRRLEVALGLVLCAVLAWVVVDGPVLRMPQSDRTFKGCVALVVLYILIDFGIRRLRSVRPAPARELGGRS